MLDKIRLFFLKVATTLVDLLFIELMTNLSLVKQMYSQSKHFTHELILWIQIERGMDHFIWDSITKNWHQVLNLWSSNPDLLWFAAMPSCIGPHSSGQYSGGPLCSSRHQAVWNKSRLSQSQYGLKEFGSNLLGLHAPATEPGFVFLSAAPGVPKRSPIQVLSKPNFAVINIGVFSSFLLKWIADKYCVPVKVYGQNGDEGWQKNWNSFQFFCFSQNPQSAKKNFGVPGKILFHYFFKSQQTFVSPKNFSAIYFDQQNFESFIMKPLRALFPCCLWQHNGTLHGATEVQLVLFVNCY